jgi:hypothetical protein
VIKAGLIGFIVGFIFVMSLTLLSPFCTLCLTPLLGAGVGYLANWFDTPAESRASLLRGGLAGGLTGIGAMAGQMLATVVNGILITNSDQLPILLADLGLSEFMITDADEYWRATLTVSAFCSAFNLVLIAGLAALGGFIWFQRQRRNSLSTVST